MSLTVRVRLAVEGTRVRLLRVRPRGRHVPDVVCVSWWMWPVTERAAPDHRLVDGETNRQMNE